LSEWRHHVEVPHSEWPGDGDRLKCLRREVSLSSVELAPLESTYNVLGVYHCRGPIESFSESFPDKYSGARMMAAHAGMDLV
jgi:hypothetical protein